jgi:glutamine cyclotransferase
MKCYPIFVVIIGLLSACNGGGSNTTQSAGTTPASPDNSQPASLGYQIIKIYPHDTACFTEGLQFVDGKILESGGQYAQSSLRFSSLETGKPLKEIKLEKRFFGEGCTQLNGKIYQMTYKENTCFVYDAVSLNKVKEFSYHFGQGWGMTTDGKNLIISNGGSNIFWYDPETFKEVKRVGVTNQYGPVGQINELEYIKGFIYANIWQEDKIVKIDPESGRVVAVFELSDLRAKTGIPNPDITSETAPEVMNGIAYDSAANRIFITGKYWPKLFEVKFDN